MPVSAPFLLASPLPVLVITNAEDFKRALAQPWLAKTPHFAVHHLAGGVAPRGRFSEKAGLSSAGSVEANEPVDKSLENPVDNPVDDRGQPAWVGYVVPKRHARRAVTRNLIRRQMRQTLADQQHSEAGLPPGLWVLRLRQGFDRTQYPSAASVPLRQAAREELHRLMGQAVRRLHEGAAGWLSRP